MTITVRETAGSATAPLSRLLVAEVGERIGVGACGSLLAQLGAEVALIEPRQARATDKWRNRALVAAGKRSFTVEAGNAVDAELLKQVLHSADVVLLSSDVTTASESEWRHDQIVCDITAFGDSGPLSGQAYSDAMVQAVSGIVDTTGNPAEAPVPVGFPILEFCAGIYAAAAIVIALRVRRIHQRGQFIDIALFDCALSTLSTFLPFHMVGKPVTRAGNRHALAAPWNAYRAADGWVLICTATDEQWQRLCVAMQQPGLARAPGYATNADRVTRCADIDKLVQQWVIGKNARECVECLSAIDIPCGPIVTVGQFAHEPNLQHRRMIHHLLDPVSNRELLMPSTPFKASRTAGRLPQSIPYPGQDRAKIATLCRSRAKPPAAGNRAPPMARPLAGVRVIEIGQYTTAPLVARQLGALGAEVLKIEPPGGDGSRGWPPHQGDQGYFFTFSNSDKRSLMLNLRDPHGKATFSGLLKTADVLVENLKPGSLSRLGFSPHELDALNPRLVYCAISGFGADSAYPERPAFDTVVQAMSGFMDLTRANGAPTKAGISAADIVGGEYSLLAILAALECRDQTGAGQHLDISMQDVATWVTQTSWNDVTPASPGSLLSCSDGYVLVEGNEPSVAARLARSEARFDAGLAAAKENTRTEFIALAQKAGVAATPILTVSEAVDSPQAVARQLIVYGVDADGMQWPLLNSPLRLKATPPLVTRPIGKLGEANQEITEKIQEWATAR